MMSEKETMLRAKQAVRERRILEAGWITTMLKAAPDSLREAEMIVVRLAFFRGAQCLLDVLKMAGDTKDEDVVTAMMNGIEKELREFFKEQKRMRDQILKPRPTRTH
jgi:hypothetical protein